MNINSLPVKWYASPVGEPVRDETTFLYTSKEAPVEADEYEHMKQRAEAAEAQLPNEQTLNVIKELFLRQFGSNPARYPAGVLPLADWLHLRA